MKSSAYNFAKLLLPVFPQPIQELPENDHGFEIIRLVSTSAFLPRFDVLFLPPFVPHTLRKHLRLHIGLLAKLSSELE